MAGVIFRDVTKRYDDEVEAVSRLSLEIADGEFMVLVGPSGCGKTTALRMVAGLEEISDGAILIGDRVVNDVPSRDRDVAMVFQSYALYPHLTVADNIAFGLKLRKMPKDEAQKRVREVAGILGLADYLERKPRHLSGGQRQRVAMGRAIVRRPSAFLMDEPLSNLDAKLRVQMRAEIARLQQELGTTTIYVTHDQTEAMTLGDRVAVMRKGRLEQVGQPQFLYDHPVNLFVAGFIGSPAMNMIPGRIEANGDAPVLAVGGQRLRLTGEAARSAPSLAGKDLVVGIRPEHMQDATIATGDADRRIKATVDLVEALGSELFVHFSVDAPPVVTEETRELAADAGAPDAQGASTEGARATVVARFDPRSKVRRGDTVDITVDTSRLLFFNPSSGEALGARAEARAR